MDPTEARAFLAHGTRTGKLAVVTANGAPHVTPVWFVLDGDAIVFNTWHQSVKARAMSRDPRVSMVVDLEEPPYAYVHVRGTVEMTADPDDLLRFATEIGARYMGPDRADEFGRRNAVEGELLVRLTPDRIVALDDVSG
jgi:PPOX class probable F420-dependent enzyme